MLSIWKALVVTESMGKKRRSRNLFESQFNIILFKLSQLLAMDVSGLVTMKDAASCDTQCDLQTSENHWIFERERRSLIFSESMFTSEL